MGYVYTGTSVFKFFFLMIFNKKMFSFITPENLYKSFINVINSFKKEKEKS